MHSLTNVSKMNAVVQGSNVEFRTVALIVEKLYLDDLASLLDAVWECEAHLSSMIPSFKKYCRTGTSDPRLTAFLRSQNGVNENLAAALLSILPRLSRSAKPEICAVIVLANHLLLGILLVHDELRRLFGRMSNMKAVLHFLEEDGYQLDVSISCISLLIHILLKDLKNMRTFEACGGGHTVLRHLHQELADLDDHHQKLHFKVIELLVLYLTNEKEIQRSSDSDVGRLSTLEKAALLRPDFPGIDSLVASINDLTLLKR